MMINKHGDQIGFQSSYKDTKHEQITKFMDDLVEKQAAQIKSPTSREIYKALVDDLASKEALDASQKAMRWNRGKDEWSLVDFQAFVPMVRVLMFGAKKYDRHNWKKGLDMNQILDSTMRHLVALMSGEELDPESGLPHVGHLQCNLMFYSHFYQKSLNETSGKTVTE